MHAQQTVVCTINHAAIQQHNSHNFEVDNACQLNMTTETHNVPKHKKRHKSGWSRLVCDGRKHNPPGEKKKNQDKNKIDIFN